MSTAPLKLDKFNNYSLLITEDRHIRGLCIHVLASQLLKRHVTKLQSKTKQKISGVSHF